MESPGKIRLFQHSSGSLAPQSLVFLCERKRTVLKHRGRMVVGNPQGSHTTEGSALLENMFSNLLSIANRQERDRKTERKDAGNQQSTGTGLHLSKASRSFKNPTRVFQIFCLIAVRFSPPANRKKKKKKQARELETMPPPPIEKQRMELEELELDQHSVTGISGDCGCSARSDSVAPIFRASFRSHKDKYNPSIPQRHQYVYKYFVRKSSRLG